MAAIDDLLEAVGRLGQTMKDIEETRRRIQGYRAQRQTLADLIDAEIVNRDALIAGSKTQLQALGDAIAAALPKEPPA